MQTADKRKKIKHVLLLVGVASLLVSLVMFNSGYDHIFEKFVTTPWTEHKYDKLNYDKRLEAKLGFTAIYLHMLRNNTPKTAVILMPPDSVFFPKGGKSQFNSLVLNKSWASYFVYPRKLVYEREQDTVLLNKAIAITHVAIAEYWGYQKLSYTLPSRERYTVLAR